MHYSEETIWQVWGKGMVIGANDPVLWRMDTCGAWIFRSQYGIKSEYGWVIDHIKPESEGGTDDPTNLFPMHWKNTTRNADGTLDCRVIAQSANNMELVENR